MGQVGCVYLNFGMWAVSLIPAWFVVKEIGGKYSKTRRESVSGSVQEDVSNTVGIGKIGA